MIRGDRTEVQLASPSLIIELCFFAIAPFVLFQKQTK